MILSITDHARLRMQQRRLSERHILAVLTAGSATVLSQFRRRYHLGEVAVVASIETGTPHVITVFRRFASPDGTRKPADHPQKQPRKRGLTDPNVKRLLRRGHIPEGI
ncbi:DUF4258 domain-containing protein [Desulfobotulus sp.]|uniref:DUF4258 domain-containing protein n=1 Tax=Desulfobotulus sp. TaxID=1940337 RepID=UPI002A36457E|nr:DUF4258 domain-containing protein [Desulfobotulus sp.]MDY0164626.1 DUF4258 domain-containing protein [Desulfobotulus sp.]